MAGEAEPVSAFAEAVAKLRAMVPMVKDDWLALEEAARSRAFTIAGIAEADLIGEVLHSLDNAMSQGLSQDEWAASVTDHLTAAWGGSVESPAWRIETIFRTNVQNAYAQGRHAQMADPEVLDDRPFWMFSTVLDHGTTACCKNAHGAVLPADHPWWADHSPPMHFNCRSDLIALTEEEAVRYGYTPGRRPPANCEPARGFGAGSVLPSAASFLGRRPWAQGAFGALVRGKLGGG